MFSLCGRRIQQASKIDVSGRSGFRSAAVTPLSEGICKRTGMFSRLKRSIVGGLLGVMLASGITANFSGCGGKESAESSVKTSATLTDGEGKAVFQIDENNFTLTTLDAETNEPIQGLQAFLATKGEKGAYLVFDPSNTYDLNILDAQQELAISTPARTVEREGITAMAMMGKRVSGLCAPMADSVILQGKTSIDIWNDPTFLEENFYPAKENVPLKDLDGSLRRVVEEFVNYLSTKGGEEFVKESLKKGFVVLGVKISGQGAAHFAGGVGLLFDWFSLCSFLENFSWANYYRQQCFSEGEEFTIWKWKQTSLLDVKVPGTNVGPFENPFFLALPSDLTRSQAVPVARIMGRVEPILSDNAPVWLKVNPPESDSVAEGWIRKYAYYPGSYDFTVATCRPEGYAVKSPARKYGDTPPTMYTLFGYDTAESETILPLPGETYMINFNLSTEEGCYRTFYYDDDRDGHGNKYFATISCSQPDRHVENKDDCNDGDSRVWREVNGECRLVSGNCSALVDPLVEGSSSAGLNPLNFAVGDGFVAYSLDGVYSVDYVNVSSGEIKSVPGVLGTFPRLSNGKIVFEALDTDDLGHSYSQIAVYDLSTQSLEVLGPGILPNVHGNLVGYLADDGVQIYDLAGDATRLIQYPPVAPFGTFPILADNTLLLQVFDSSGTIFSYDLAAGGEWQSIEIGVPQTVFSCHGNKCVFGSDLGTMYAYDVTTHEATEIIPRGQPPVIWGDNVVFYKFDYAQPAGIYVYNLATGETTPLMQRDEFLSPVIHERSVAVWGVNTLYYCTIPLP